MLRCYVGPKRDPNRKVGIEDFQGMLQKMKKHFVRMFGEEEWRGAEQDLCKRFEGMNHCSIRIKG